MEVQGLLEAPPTLLLPCRKCRTGEGAYASYARCSCCFRACMSLHRCQSPVQVVMQPAVFNPGVALLPGHWLRCGLSSPVQNSKSDLTVTSVFLVPLPAARRRNRQQVAALAPAPGQHPHAQRHPAADVDWRGFRAQHRHPDRQRRHGASGGWTGRGGGQAIGAVSLAPGGENWQLRGRLPQFVCAYASLLRLLG